MNSSMIINSEFSSAHFYNQKKWDEQKNNKTFGACYTEYGHGHNYKLKVKIEIPKNKSEPEWIKNCQNSISSITRELDHQHLNFVIPEFKEVIPTTENISLYLKNKILQSPLAKHVISFRLYEMDDIWTQVQIKNPSE